VFLPYGNIVLAVRWEEHSDRGLLNVQGACLLGDPAHRNILLEFNPFKHKNYGLNLGAVRDHSVFRNYDDSISDAVVIPVIIFKLFAVDDLNARPDPGVFVNDCALYEAIAANADARMAAIDICLQLVQGLVKISSHHQDSFQTRAVLDSASNSDD
jgi:hypothetical protein